MLKNRIRNVKKHSLLTSILVLIIAALGGCQQKQVDYSQAAANPAFLHQSVGKLTEVITHDIFSPPVASRVYVYPQIAAYEVLRNEHPEYQSLTGQLTNFEGIPQPAADSIYCYPLASLNAFLTVGRQFTFSSVMFDAYEEELYEKYRKMGVPEDVFARSIRYGQAAAKSIIAYASEDGYKQTRGYRHNVSQAEGHWVPTPPAYMDAIEPNWNKLRPFVIDSCSQFAPPKPVAYNPTPGSDFYKEVMEVYDATTNMTKEQREIASFWDCNPFVMHTTGHVMYATKKITPGGHWLGITGLATRKANADMMQTLEAYTRVSVALADGFISCWDEKYRSDKIRPESVINALVDEKWVPLLQTPPFPEYPSGHSVISNAAAVVLTDLFGPSFAFADSTEVTYGLPVRSFTSFEAAAEEAAISRLYGGIHFMPAIVNGAAEGKQVGTFIVSKLNTRKRAEKPAAVASSN
ncbi:vanadium-dependent haloperoxidase [Pontibacter sp. E15-1]|uniref:vanadium-dependent haloperoxidase n=1 Tax=Pontibacter sp. E15-1 TaxID=2919918 RepID=UPI001F4FB725|nr:vanadium-dependent haloperoxidase [Pontibacter sp. E15-1]MCJ8164581.1 vanadium-dependent haloperoxidase [Pontibacter sp. E15-1]